MNKLLHHFGFKTVLISSFTFRPVKIFSSENTSCTSYALKWKVVHYRNSRHGKYK